MKYILAFAFFIFTVHCMKIDGRTRMTMKLREAAEKCKPKTNATDVDVKEYFANAAASTSEGKCLRSCIYLELDVIDDSGKFKRAEALRACSMYVNSDPEDVKTCEKVIDICKELRADNRCETAELSNACFFREWKRNKN